MWYFPATKSPRKYCIRQIDIMEPKSQERSSLTYTREDLMLGAFILHAHAQQKEGYLQCLCDHQCKYFILNEERKQENDYEQYEQRQVFEESRNKGYPDELVSLVKKEDLGLFEFLGEMYSVYRHLEIEHKVFAELAMETRFDSEEEKKQHWLGWGFDSVHFNYREQSTHFVFTVTVKLAASEDVKELELIVGKTGFETSKQSKNAVVSENQCIVFFSWLLTAEEIIKAGLEGCKQALASISSNKPKLQGKLNSIRSHSLTRLYDLSYFY